MKQLLFLDFVDRYENGEESVFFPVFLIFIVKTDYLITFSSLPTLMNAAIARSKCSRS